MKPNKDNCHYCDERIKAETTFFTIACGTFPHHHSDIVFHDSCFMEVAGTGYVTLLTRQALISLKGK